MRWPLSPASREGAVLTEARAGERPRWAGCPEARAASPPHPLSCLGPSPAALVLMRQPALTEPGMTTGSPRNDLFSVSLRFCYFGLMPSEVCRGEQALCSPALPAPWELPEPAPAPGPPSCGAGPSWRASHPALSTLEHLFLICLELSVGWLESRGLSLLGSTPPRAGTGGVCPGVHSGQSGDEVWLCSAGPDSPCL